MAVGISFGGAATYLYQGLSGQVAMLRFDGRSYLASLGNLAMSFLCGPFILMKLGWQGQQNGGGSLSVANLLIGSLVGFGWGFINGLLLLGAYFAVVG